MPYRKKPELLFETIGDKVVVFDTARRQPFVLNRLAARVLMDSNGLIEIGKMAEAVSRDHDTSQARAAADLVRLYDELEAKGLAERV